MSVNIILIIYLFLSFLIDKYKCLYITSGLNTIHNFLYLSRISKYYNQSKKEICSLKDGSDCYFTEKNYIKNILKEKLDSINEKEWFQLYSKIQDNNYKVILYQLSQQTSDYIESYSNEEDTEQNPPNEKLNIVMTFDDETTKSGMYLHQLKATFYNEQLIANIEGKLRLSDKKQDNSENKEKEVDYPSKLYGIIESDLVSISFNGKLFLFNSVYIRAKNENSKSEKLNFFGYFGEQIVYGYSFTDNDKNKKSGNWLKVTSNTFIPADKLVLSGPFEIDNIQFTFYYEPNVNFDDIYQMNSYKNKKNLINDDEI